MSDIISGIFWLIEKIFEGLFWCIQSLFELLEWIWELPWYIYLGAAVLWFLVPHLWRVLFSAVERIRSWSNSRRRQVGLDNPANLADPSVEKGRVVMVSKTRAVQPSIFFVLLGLIALLADVITIGNFIVAKKFMRDVWSAEWLLSIVLILGLMAVGLALIAFGGKTGLAAQSARLFGLFYLLLALVIYFTICQRLLSQDVASSGGDETELRWALWFMFWVSGTMGFGASMQLANGAFLRQCSYLLGLLNLVFALGVVYNYNFLGKEIVGDSLIAEALAFLIGSVLVFWLFVAGPADDNLSSLNTNA